MDGAHEAHGSGTAVVQIHWLPFPGRVLAPVRLEGPKLFWCIQGTPCGVQEFCVKRFSGM